MKLWKLTGNINGYDYKTLVLTCVRRIVIFPIFLIPYSELTLFDWLLPDTFLLFTGHFSLQRPH